MILYLDGHSLRYEMQALCFALFPGEKVLCTDAAEGPVSGDSDIAYTKIKKGADGSACAFVLIRRGGREQKESERISAGFEGRKFKLECEAALGRAMYRAAAALTGIRPPWGTLTGIRPVKLVRTRRAAGMSDGEIVNDLETRFYTSEDKIRLCIEASRCEERITALSGPCSASLYISIPFCPSRCLYCSFISHDIEKAKKLIPEYVRLLCAEIDCTGRLLNELGLNLETVYMGGGTPTALDAQQLTMIFDAVKKSFKTDRLREYTVEAGRPDTITPEKLKAIVLSGATRISINPQTLNDDILRRIGRKHTVRQVYDAFRMAREAGIGSINMDLIAGLPGDTPEGFERTLDGVMGLDPESVTVHTLAMKRASNLVSSGGGIYDAAAEDVNAMLNSSRGRLTAAGYAPYYLYRQKNTLGGLENVGYAKPGYEGLYNIYIMDETHTILSAGAGAVTKLRQPLGDRIERVFNFKYPYEYISRFDDIIDRKKKVKDFYAEYRTDYRQGQGSRERGKSLGERE